MLQNSFCICVIVKVGSTNLPFRLDGTGFVFNYSDKQILIINKILVDKIGDDQELLFILKQNINGSVSTLGGKLKKEDFLVNNLIPDNSAIAVLKEKINCELFSLEENYTPPILLNNSKLKVLAIDNVNHTSTNLDYSSPYVLKEFSGTVINTRKKLELENLPITENQDLVYLADEIDFGIQTTLGGIVYCEKNGKKLPIGLTNYLTISTVSSFNGSIRGYYWSFTYLGLILGLLNESDTTSYVQGYNNRAEFFIENSKSIAQILAKIANGITDKFQKLDLEPPLKQFISDNMLSLRGEIISFKFNVHMIEHNMNDKLWWEFTHKSLPPNPKAIPFHIQQYETTILRSFFVGFFSVTEFLLRETLRKIDPKILNNATKELRLVIDEFFKNVTFSVEKTEFYSELFKIQLRFRNTIHNDWYYFPNWKGATDDELMYRGNKYSFFIGEKINLSYQDYFYLIEDTLEFIWDIFDSEFVKNGFSKYNR